MQSYYHEKICFMSFVDIFSRFNTRRNSTLLNTQCQENSWVSFQTIRFYNEIYYIWLCSMCFIFTVNQFWKMKKQGYLCCNVTLLFECSNSFFHQTLQSISACKKFHWLWIRKYQKSSSIWLKYIQNGWHTNKHIDHIAFGDRFWCSKFH